MITKSELDFIKKLRYEKRTLVTDKRLINLLRHVKSFKGRNDICFVECGVAKGGCLALIKKNCDSYAKIYGFDSFEGMPELTEKDKNETRALRWIGKKMADYRDVARTFKIMNISDENVVLIKGYFSDTLATKKHIIDKPNAILRLDADWHESTKICLDELYDMVMPGGIIIIDDYDAYIGCRTAVDEFRSNRGITDNLISTDERIPGLSGETERWWKKS